MVDDSIYQLVNQGWQVKNTLTNGIYYDNRDNVFNTTKGLRAELSADLVGSILGGADHYLWVEQSIQYYWWAFDFTFFNLIRKIFCVGGGQYLNTGLTLPTLIS